MHQADGFSSTMDLCSIQIFKSSPLSVLSTGFVKSKAKCRLLEMSPKEPFGNVTNVPSKVVDSAVQHMSNNYVQLIKCNKDDFLHLSLNDLLILLVIRSTIKFCVLEKLFEY
jgi:hypothetical protein